MDKIVIKHEGNVIADFREAAKVGNAEVQEFINYVYMFYGPGGVYDMGVTKEDIAKATAVRLLSFPEIEFAGAISSDSSPLSTFSISFSETFIIVSLINDS